ncbi:hypothetical protein NPIL_602431 [Nephila pilipes]|uniref:Uncharacterized protein n=1 Tax=Nephila pilipes TaxID=299642 RepID=A0A8X6PQ16_NEPPI|nr:hypothetical protein NPIL_602431 [Nephila pilipes]
METELHPDRNRKMSEDLSKLNKKRTTCSEILTCRWPRAVGNNNVTNRWCRGRYTSMLRSRLRNRCSEVYEQATSTNHQLQRRGCLVNVRADRVKAIRIKDYLTCQGRLSESPTLKTIICVSIFLLKL